MAENHGMVDQRMQIFADWPQRIFLNRLSLGPAKMRHQNSFRAVIAEVIDGRQAFADSGVISDANFAAANFGRHVEVHPHQHAFPADIEITDRNLRHYLLLLLLLLMLMLMLNRVKSFVFTQELCSSRKSLQHSHEHVHDSDEPFLGGKDPLTSDGLSHRKHIEAGSTLERGTASDFQK